jgi:hypothetical protein
MPIKPVTGKIEAQAINDNLSYLESEKRDRSVKISQLDVTEEFLQQMAGNTPINAVPANNSLTLKQTTYSKVVSKNLFDKSAAQNGRIDGATGTYVNDVNYYSSEYIPVIGGQILKFSSNVSRYAVYNENREYISGENLTTPITQYTVPPGAFFIRVTFYYTNLENFMLVVNDLPASYEPYRRVIEGEYINLGDNTVNYVKTDFMTLGKNLFNVEDATTDQYVNYTTGKLSPNTSYLASDYIEVEPSQNYSINRHHSSAFYDKNKVFISGNNTVSTTGITLTVPANAKYIRFTVYKTDVDSTQIEVGSESTVYEPYGYKIPKLIGSSVSGGIEDEVNINLPDTLYATINEEFNIFTSNLLKEKASEYNINYIASFGKQMTDKFTYTPSTTGTQSLTVEVYERSKMVATKTVNVLVSPSRSTPLKVMLIGDSTVNAGTVTQRLVNKLGANIQLVGTRGITPNLHEGRGGWTAGTYRSNSSYDSVVNPFYNPTAADFDFGYYMTNNGFTGLDVVIIQLGINDTFSPTTDSTLETRISEVKMNFDFIINNIKTYDPNIKIALNLTIPPNDNQDAFGNAYGADQTQWRYKYNNHIWVGEMISYFDGVCDLVNVHSSIDTKTNIADGVHPTTTGYNQIGDTDYSYLNSLT